jgi:hypothetical protein
MNEKQSQSSARTVGWDRLETFHRNHHLKRGVHLNDIRKFIACLTVKELPQIANKNGFNFVYGSHSFFFFFARMVRNAKQNSCTFYRQNPKLFNVTAHIVCHKYSALNNNWY